MALELKFQLLPGQIGFICAVHLKNTFSTVRYTESGVWGIKGP
jgi:hypothetical protein